MAARRSANTMERLRAVAWDSWRMTYYAQFQCCDDCGEPHYCVGRRREKLRCKTCHMLRASV